MKILSIAGLGYNEKKDSGLLISSTKRPSLSIIFKILPYHPAAKRVFSSTKHIENKLFAVIEGTSVHFSPPSVVFRIVP
jgi:hypothetical protein